MNSYKLKEDKIEKVAENTIRFQESTSNENINNGVELRHVIGPLYIKKTLKHFNFPDRDTIKRILIGIFIIVIGIGIIIEMQSFNNKDIDTLVHNKYSTCVINGTGYKYTDWFSSIRITDDINEAEIAIIDITTDTEERVLYFEKKSSLLNNLIFHKIAFKEIGDYPKYCVPERYVKTAQNVYWEDIIFKVNSEGTFAYNYKDNTGWEKVDNLDFSYPEMCFYNDYYAGQSYVFISKEEADKKIQELIKENTKETFDKGVE